MAARWFANFSVSKVHVRPGELSKSLCCCTVVPELCRVSQVPIVTVDCSTHRLASDYLGPHCHENPYINGKELKAWSMKALRKACFSKLASHSRWLTSIVCMGAGVLWASVLGSSLAYQWSRPIPTQLKIIHSRVYAQVTCCLFLFDTFASVSRHAALGLRLVSLGLIYCK